MKKCKCLILNLRTLYSKLHTRIKLNLCCRAGYKILGPLGRHLPDRNPNKCRLIQNSCAYDVDHQSADIFTSNEFISVKLNLGPAKIESGKRLLFIHQLHLLNSLKYIDTLLLTIVNLIFFYIPNDRSLV